MLISPSTHIISITTITIAGEKNCRTLMLNESLLANKTEPLKLDKNELVATADPDIVKNSHPQFICLRRCIDCNKGV